MTYADFALAVPPTLQTLISILVTAGISVTLVWAFHGRLLALAQEPKHEEDDPSPRPPDAYWLSGRIIQVTSLGFIFLFTFTVGQFVLNARSADNATQLEAQYYSRALTTAQQMPADTGRDEMVAALTGYRTLVVEEEWPLMQRGDSVGAYEVQGAAAGDVSAALTNAQRLGAAETTSWEALTSSIDDMTIAATDRLGDVPTQNAVTLVLGVIFLGVVSLTMTAVFQPARRGINLVLIGILAGVYGVLFHMVVELSNPFQGSGAITSLMAVMP